jgi:hypothetical protein
VVVSQSRNWFMHSNRLFTVVNCFLHRGWSLRLWLLVAGLLFVTVTKSCFCTVGGQSRNKVALIPPYKLLCGNCVINSFLYYATVVCVFVAEFTKIEMSF